MCSSDGDVVDKTKATRRVFATVVAGGPNSDEGTPRRFGRARDGWFHDGVNCFAYRAESTLNRVQRRRAHYSIFKMSPRTPDLTLSWIKTKLTVQVALGQSGRNLRLTV